MPRMKKRYPPSSEGRSATKPRRASTPGLKVHWAKSHLPYDHRDTRTQRHFQLETLERSVERLTHTHDSLFYPAMAQSGGPSPLSTLRFELVRESANQLLFRVFIANQRGRKATFGWVVAKRTGDASRQTESEHGLLRVLQGRAGGRVVRTLTGGMLSLTHPGDSGSPRSVYTYMRQWLADYLPVSVCEDLQIVGLGERPVKMSKVDTMRVQGSMVETVVSAYDPAQQESMAMPEVPAGDFLILRPARGAPKIKLVTCTRMLRRVSPPKLLDKLLSARWQVGSSWFHLAPPDADDFVAAVSRGAGEDVTREWLSAYADQVRFKNLPERPPLTSEELSRIIARRSL